MFPLILFPEGVVSNGNQLLTFKKGAFKPLLPLKIILCIYKSELYRPFYSMMKVPHNSVIMMCLLPIELTLIEF